MLTKFIILKFHNICLISRYILKHLKKLNWNIFLESSDEKNGYKDTDCKKKKNNKTAMLADDKNIWWKISIVPKQTDLTRYCIKTERKYCVVTEYTVCLAPQDALWWKNNWDDMEIKYNNFSNLQMLRSIKMRKWLRSSLLWCNYTAALPGIYD